MVDCWFESRPDSAFSLFTLVLSYCLLDLFFDFLFFIFFKPYVHLFVCLTSLSGHQVS